jgi:hypothetical protein
MSMARKYGKKASKKVEKAMHELKRRNAAQRAIGQEGEEPQAGHRHRASGGAPRRRQGAEAAAAHERQETKERLTARPRHCRTARALHCPPNTGEATDV